MFTWQKGQSYIGQVHENKSHGYGKITLGDEEEIEGHWRRGRLHGLGIKRTNCVNHGLWEDGKRVCWFDQVAATLIEQGKLDFRSHFRNSQNQSEKYEIYFEQKLMFNSKLKLLKAEAKK